ncbi:hypothetical protein RHMOL_Rhmol08G0070700 [Rhododendron molle]|uniref:Uncharacterized protein n=1 Tax=Rhododendron molle TaxID=49168 RepID=A0ACC0MLU8_RHOML|nr:hypothetical protein RHMOL_Rhmol08G0070700 [Rhododendron molle]
MARWAWNEVEEEILLTNLTSLVDQGVWQAENEFRPGYLEVLENQMRVCFPEAGIKQNHIEGKVKIWKRDYFDLTLYFKFWGFGGIQMKINWWWKMMFGMNLFEAPFNGQDGVLAHAFPPTNGKFHYNGDYSFTVNSVAGSYHLETVALHEIGHLLGLGHSNVQDAIMFPRIPPATIKGLSDDDIRGIRTLYA